MRHGACSKKSRAARVTQTQLATSLREWVYGLGQGLISQMAHGRPAVAVAAAALKGGMGRPQVERIRQLERAAQVSGISIRWIRKTTFEQTFAALCRRYDDPNGTSATWVTRAGGTSPSGRDLSIHAISITLDG